MTANDLAEMMINGELDYSPSSDARVLAGQYIEAAGLLRAVAASEDDKQLPLALRLEIAAHIGRDPANTTR